MIQATLSYVVTGLSDLYPIISSLLPPLNEKNLPWIDVIHPIVVHFVIAMAFFCFLIFLILHMVFLDFARFSNIPLCFSYISIRVLGCSYDALAFP